MSKYCVSTAEIICEVQLHIRGLKQNELLTVKSQSLLSTLSKLWSILLSNQIFHISHHFNSLSEQLFVQFIHPCCDGQFETSRLYLLDFLQILVEWCISLITFCCWYWLNYYHIKNHNTHFVCNFTALPHNFPEWL